MYLVVTLINIGQFPTETLERSSVLRHKIAKIESAECATHVIRYSRAHAKNTGCAGKSGDRG